MFSRSIIFHSVRGDEKAWGHCQVGAEQDGAVPNMYQARVKEVGMQHCSSDSVGEHEPGQNPSVGAIEPLAQDGERRCHSAQSSSVDAGDTLANMCS